MRRALHRSVVEEGAPNERASWGPVVARQAATRQRVGAEVAAHMAARKAQQIPRENDLFDDGAPAGMGGRQGQAQPHSNSVDLMPKHVRRRRQQREQQQQQQQQNQQLTLDASMRPRSPGSPPLLLQLQMRPGSPPDLSPLQQQLRSGGASTRRPELHSSELPFSPVGTPTKHLLLDGGRGGGGSGGGYGSGYGGGAASPVAMTTAAAAAAAPASGAELLAALKQQNATKLPPNQVHPLTTSGFLFLALLYSSSRLTPRTVPTLASLLVLDGAPPLPRHPPPAVHGRARLLAALPAHRLRARGRGRRRHGRGQLAGGGPAQGAVSDDLEQVLRRAGEEGGSQGVLGVLACLRAWRACLRVCLFACLAVAAAVVAAACAHARRLLPVCPSTHVLTRSLTRSLYIDIAR